MLSEKEILEIRDHLERAQNPIFYFDNDADGLCSYLLLRRYIDRGKGVAVRSFPDLNVQYARKAQELNADYVFVLDKPLLSREFVDEIETLGLPIVWIDHHDVEKEDYGKSVAEYNPAKNKERSEEPVTYWSYKITERREDIWLAVIGCIADHYLPDFAEDFAERWPDYWKDGIEEPFDAYYGSEIGRIARAFNFGLKDSVSNVVKMQNFLLECKNPSEVFEESGGNYAFRKKYNDLRKRHEDLLERAQKELNGNLIFFEYGGDMSISADLSNELSYRNKDKYIAVIYRKGAISNLSLRGKGVKKILERVLLKVDGSGGGHDDAVGARLKTEDLGRFREVLVSEIENENSKN